MDKKLRVLQVNVPFVKFKLYVTVVSILVDLVASTFIEFAVDRDLCFQANQEILIALMG